MREADGEFWLPVSDESAREVVQGRLRIEDDGDATLELFGTFTAPEALGDPMETPDGTVTRVTATSLARHSRHDRIVGQSGGEAFTLEDCFVIGRTGLFSNALRETYTVGQVFVGASFEPDEPIEFVEMHLKIDGLLEWLEVSGVTQEMTFDESDGPTRLLGARLSMERRPSIELDHPVYSEASLEHVWSITGGIGQTPQFTQDVVLRLQSATPLPPADFLEVGGDVRSLVALGGDIDAGFVEVKFFRDDVRHRNEPDGPRIPIEMIARWTVQAEAERGPMVDNPFHFGDIGGATALSGFLERATKHRSSLVRVMHTHHSDRMLVSDRLMNCAAALEAYDRETVAESFFRDRIIRIVDGVGEPFESLVGNAHGWATALKNARHDVAHHNPQMRSSGPEQLFLAESAKWLLVMALLAEAGVSKDSLASVIDSARGRWLRRGLAEVFARGYPQHGQT